MRESTAAYFILALFLFGGAPGATAAEDLYGTRYIESSPFWKTRNSLQKRILEERFIVVSASNESPKSQTPIAMTTWKFRGSGVVKTPLAFLWEYSRDFQKLAKIEDVFKRVTYDPEAQKLFLKLSLLGREKEMIVHFEFAETPIDKRMHWKNLEGLYKGMEGVVIFRALDKNRTEVSLFSGLEAESSYVPTWMITLGVEALMQRVSTSLRTNAESAYNN